MKNLSNNTSASSFMWVICFITAFIFALIYAILNDILKPMYEYSLEVNPTDPIRDFFADSWDILPVIFLITMVFVIISASQREGDSN